MSTRVQRKLTTILAADAAAFSRAMETDELTTLNALRAARRVFAKLIERHEGRIVNTAGDGLIAEFASVVEAVQCAIEVQSELASEGRTQDGALRFRIGIHLGDVMIDGSDLLGEGVNLAARLESMAEPGGILISQQVYDQVQKKLSVGFEYLGERRPKNFNDDVSVYRLSLGHDRNRTGWAWRKAPSSPQPKFAAPARDEVRESTIRQARLLSAILIVLSGINLLTGDNLWVHWPGLVIGVYIALKAAPLFAQGFFGVSFVRVLIIVAGLVLINLFSWSGEFWAIWPCAVVVAVEFIRHWGFSSSR